MEKKSAAINGRISPSLRQRLDAIHKKHLTLDSTVLTYLLEAFCDYAEKTGKVEVPFEISTSKPTQSKRAS